MGTLTVDDEVLATLTEIAAKEGLSLDELTGQVLGDFIRKKQISEEVSKLLPISWTMPLMSFELRQPITVILGFSDLLLATFSELSETDIKRNIEVIKQSAHILMKTINTLFDLARIENGHFPLAPENVDLNLLLQQNIDSLQTRNKDKSLHLTLDGREKSQVFVDKDRLWRVLDDFILTITLHTESNIVSVSTEVVGDMVNIMICHKNGNYKEAVDFFNEDLGMSVAKYILEKHNAQVTLNQEGDGVTLAITLPIAQG